jgi:hypothetical protein
LVSLIEAHSRTHGDKWIKVVLEEIRAHLDNWTWELADLPYGERAMERRWVFKIKKNVYLGRHI